MNAHSSAVLAARVPAQFEAVQINYAAVSPMLIVAAAALIGVLVGAFAPRAARHTAQVAVALAGLWAALVALVVLAVPNKALTFGNSIVIDGPALFMQATLLVFAIMGVLTMSERYGGDSVDAFTPMGAASPGSPQEVAAGRAGMGTSEVFPLTMFAVLGMLMFVCAGDLITMFVALEVLSLPLYVLSGLARRRRLLSLEASLKYFLLGAFSSGFFIFGAALLYGYAGSTDFARIAAAISAGTTPFEGLLLPGVLLVLIGLLFKVGAVPFHSWTPDAYQGAPTPVTGFMAAATKLAAFGALLRFTYVAVEASRLEWRLGVAAIAALTMVLGSVLSVGQTDVKRLLAYSSVAHAGFILVGLLAFDITGITGVMFYLTAYGLSTIAAFAIVSLVRSGGSEATDLAQWAGLGKRSPVVAAIFSLLLLAFAGIPLTSGFTAKFAVFAPAVAHGGLAGLLLVIIGVLASAITAYVYFRIMVLMYFREPESGEGAVAISGSIASTVAITIGVAGTIVLGILPGPVLDLAGRVSQFFL